MKLKKYDSINVIPFIDVLLVLLTIVLMTSTFISKGIIPISLPTASNADNIKVNKETIGASSEGYKNRQDCLDNIKNLKKKIEYLEKNNLII